MKIKLLMTAATVVLFASPSWAAKETMNYHERVSNSPFTGAYLGVYGGYDWSDADTNVANFSPDLDGWDWGVFGGVKLDALMDRMNDTGIGLNGAVEVFYGMSNSDDHIGLVEIEKENEWGVSFRPGLSFMDSMTDSMGISPYGILGYRNTEFKAFAGGASGSSRYHGFDLGVGTELLAFGDWGVRAEYTHTWYGSKHGIDPNSDDVRVGISYHF